MTDNEKNVLRMIESRVDTVSWLVCRLAERAFTAEDQENVAGLQDALNQCAHDLRVVQLLDQ